MRTMLCTTAAVALVAGASSLAFAQTANEPVTPATPTPAAPMAMTYQEPAPQAPTVRWQDPVTTTTTTTTKRTTVAKPAKRTVRTTEIVRPEFGTSSHDYPRGRGVEWQQSYQLGARPEISGSTTVGINDVTSQSRYERLVRRPVTDEIPAYGSSMPPAPPIYGR